MQPHLLSAAQQTLNNIKDTLPHQESYGDVINEFFNSTRTDEYTGWADIVNCNNKQEDDDDWFDDEDNIDKMVKKGVVGSSFFTFLAEQVEEDKQSVTSWDTGGMTYTEQIIANRDMSKTDTSSITQDTGHDL